MPAFVVLASISGCGADKCESLCEDVALLLDQCVDDWPVTWDELGAGGRVAYRNECRENWSDVRSELESWELDDALAQCEEGSTALQRTTATATSCDELRALYALE